MDRGGRLGVGCRVRVAAKEGRMYEGDLLATDEHMNVVLCDTEEFQKTRAAPETRRYLGFCVLRGSFVVGITAVSGPAA